MFLKDFGFFDRFVLGLALALLVGSVTAMLNDAWMYELAEEEGQKLQKIGNVSLSYRDVRRRYKTRFSWMPTDESAAVYAGDSIFTGPDSHAVIATADGGELVISPNSLVVINAREDGIQLDIDFGSIQGKIDKGGRLVVKSDSGVAEFNGESEDSVVKVDVSRDKELLVNVLEGRVDLNNGGRSQRLSASEVTEIDASGKMIDPKDIRIELAGPLKSGKFDAGKVDLNQLVFEWKTNQPFAKYVVQMAADPDFRRILREETTAMTELKVANLPNDQKIFWRVSGQVKPDAPITRSETGQFMISTNTPPGPVFPESTASFAFERQNDPRDEGLHVALRWRAKTPADRWEVQVSLDPNFARDTKTYLSKTESATTDLLGTGTYHWRVRDSERGPEGWSSVSRFTIERRSAEAVKAPMAQTEAKIFYVKTIARNADAEALRKIAPDQAHQYMERVPRLQWAPVEGAVKYNLEIAADGDFQKIVYRGVSTGTSFDWKGVRLGDYHWRVQALGTRGAGATSKAQPLSVRLTPPETQTRTSFTEEIADLSLADTLPPPFELRWTPTLFTAEYEIEFDSTPQFQKPLVLKSMDTLKPVQVKAPGSYFWRVRSLNDKSQPISEFSSPFPYEFQRAVKNPEQAQKLRAIYPNQRETLVFVGSKSTPIIFRWTTPYTRGTIYEVELASDAEFNQVVMTAALPSASHKFAKMLPPGWWFWRMRAKTPHFTSPWSTTYTFNVKYENTPFQFTGKDRLQALREMESQNLIKLNPGAQARVAMPAAGTLNSLLPPTAKEVSTAASTIGAARGDFVLDSPGEGEVNWASLSAAAVKRTFATVKSYPNLQWDPVTGAAGYALEISSSPKFSPATQLLKVNLTEPQFLWTQAQPGTFYWRVQTPGAAATPRLLHVKVRAPVSLTPNFIVQRSKAVGPPRAFQLVWSPLPLTRRYELEFATDPAFTNKKVFVENDHGKNLKVSAAGTYYWRVRGLDATGQASGPFSHPHSVTIVQVPDSDRAPAPAFLEFPRREDALTLVGDEFAALPFQWIPAMRGGEFTLEIATAADFKNVVHRVKTESERVLVIKKLAEGAYHWRLGFEKNREGVTWSASQSFTIKRLPAPREEVLIRQPTSEARPSGP